MNKWLMALRLDKVSVNPAEFKYLPKRPLRGRMLFQLHHPRRVGENVMTTFTFPLPLVQDLDEAAIGKLLTDRLVFKEEIIQGDDAEQLSMDVGFSMDARRNWWERFLGKFIEIAIDGVVEGLALFGVKIGKMVGKAEGLKLGDKYYSLKLGFHEASTLLRDGVTSDKWALEVPKTVEVYAFPEREDHEERPKRTVVAEKDAKTCTVHFTLTLRPC